MTTSFTFTYPDFSSVQSIGWYPKALTFTVVVKFNDGATVTGSLSGVGLETLFEQAKAASIPLIELCPCCQVNPGRERWTTDGDTIIICDTCAAVEEF